MAKQAAIESCRITLTPDSGWGWDGWNGELQISVSPQNVFVSGKPAVRESDFVNSSVKLAGKAYKSTAFSDIPGTVISASISVDQTTLSPVVQANGELLGTVATNGKFDVKCFPSQKIVGAGTMFDVAVSQAGTWKVLSTDAGPGFV